MDVCNTEQSSKHVVIQDVTVWPEAYCGGQTSVIECGDQISLKEIYYKI